MNGLMFLQSVLLLIPASYALFEDQVGKFDWRQSFVGCPSHVAFEHSTSGKRDYILLTTKQNAVAALSLNTGKIVWRRLLEKSSADLPLVVINDLVVTVADGGRIVRAWDKRKGGLRWSLWLSDVPSDKVSIAATGKVVVVIAAGTVVVIDTQGGNEEWRTMLAESDWNAMVRVLPSSRSSFSISTPSLFLLAGRNGRDVVVTPIDDSGLVSDEATTHPAPFFHSENCVVSGGFVWCVNGDSLSAIPLVATSAPSPFKLSTSSSNSLLPLQVDGAVAVRGVAGSAAFRIVNGQINKVVTVSGAVEAMAAAEMEEEAALLVASPHRQLTLYSLKDGSKMTSASLGGADSHGLAAFSLLHLSKPTASSSEWQVLAVSADCRTEFIVLDAKRKGVGMQEWAREEALARVSSVEMIELPLSESQASIESEFETADVGVLGAFLRRLSTQMMQLRRFILEVSLQLTSLPALLNLKEATLGDILETVRSGGLVHAQNSGPLERDVFNMRRIMLISSLDGAIFGVDNADGSVVWRRSVASHLVPLSGQLGQPTVPILVQRSANYPGFNAIVTFVLQDKSSGNGVLLSVEPLSGRVLASSQVGPIHRVDILPQAGIEHLHSLVVVEKSGKVVIEPEIPLSVAERMMPVHIFDIDTRSGELTGSVLDIKRGLLERRWHANLHFEKRDSVVAIRGKPNHQRVHSAGRVLIDRSVQYKYTNPNVVALAVLNEEKDELAIHAVDSVSGALVHSARLSKASAPVHLVHAEHWIAYSYWSERARRTELGIIELFTGQDEPATTVFDSLQPPKTTPEVISQSYIFSQGIEAMAVSETEKGATTRSLVLALPFGGLFEVTRRMVDATRPAELTAEMREEMMIPYMPEIPISTEDMINYNQTVFNVRGIRTFSSGLESTSLVLAYGIDMFYTRLTPSGTFDILKDDFDHGFITLVLVGLFAGSFICKRIVRRNALRQAWS